MSLLESGRACGRNPHAADLYIFGKRPRRSVQDSGMWDLAASARGTQFQLGIELCEIDIGNA